MNFSLEQLEAFIASVEAGSFSGAARKLGKAQSSISGLISNMEIDAGFDLFDRSTRSPALTKEGTILLREIKSVLKSHQMLLHKVDSLVQEVDVEIRIAFDPLAFPRQYLMYVLEDFQQKFPSTSVLLLNSSHDEAYRMIKNDRADLAITLSKDDYPEGLQFRGIAHVHYHTVASTEHELTKLPQVHPEDLAQHRHIRITDSLAGFRSYDSDLSTNIWYADNSSMLLDLVKQGFGWAELPKHLTDGEAGISRLQTYHQAVSFPQNVDLIWANESILGVAGQWLIEKFTEVGSTISR